MEKAATKSKCRQITRVTKVKNKALVERNALRKKAKANKTWITKVVAIATDVHDSNE